MTCPAIPKGTCYQWTVGKQRFAVQAESDSVDGGIVAMRLGFSGQARTVRPGEIGAELLRVTRLQTSLYLSDCTTLDILEELRRRETVASAIKVLDLVKD